MLKKIKQERSDLLNDQEKAEILGGNCALECHCGSSGQCGNDLAFYESDENAG